MALASGRATSLLALAALLSVVGFLAGPAAAAGKTGQVTVFWGRNKAEGSLREACDSGMYTIVIMSFLDVYGHGKYSLDLSGHPIAGIGNDIKHCQSKNILVFLSIGGFGNKYSLPTSQSAADVADYLWNAYLAGSRRGVSRPFGDAAVDGIDFFIEHGSSDHYDELARCLWSYNKAYRARTPVQLTATPRCAYPDQRLEAALATGLFNRIHVRLYGDQRCTWSARESWEKWAAAYPGSRIFVGVVASPEADADAYMSPKDLYYGVLQFAQKLPNYGGIMIWNRYYDKKTGYMGG